MRLSDYAVHQANHHTLYPDGNKYILRDMVIVLAQRRVVSIQFLVIER